MECKICKSKSFTSVFNNVVCDVCGAIYDMDDLEDIKDFEKSKLFSYFKERVENIKDDKKREYIKGLFFGYYDTLVRSEWKKAKLWAIKQIGDLLKKLEG